ncbi:MAG: hypothetical protein M3R02_22545 [Chloroflexota bacterium]|nr:hypothetical protein [Chloroflexota bacterium]
MSTATTRRIAQTTAEDLHRLAGQAERRGIRILVDHRTGAHVATSASDPTRCYQVDAEQGCTCKGYGTWGRCQHHSLLLAELGRLPEVEPVVTDVVILDEQPAPCRSCRGSGFVRMTTGPGLADWQMVPCTKCPGHHAPSPRPVAVHAA